ncbi:MAG: hypothetical protein AUH84_02420 [Thaumarchaeota archaeon 13_1_40CM_4_38_7]|nr:MAG: hypothetical protein AUH84_02420 [Thaumarchaeota archaeon 13_1_40CM_4_38_7]
MTVRRKNWFTAMGVLFIVVGAIAVVRDLFIFGPDFVVDFFTSPEITSEKISATMFGIGGFLIILGLRGVSYEE